MAKKREARFIISAENKTAATLSKVNSDVSRLGGTFQKFGKLVGPALATLATGAAIKGFANMIQRVNGVTDSLAKQSDRLGIATEALQGYRNAASLAGVSQASLEKGIAKLNRTIGEIKTGIITATSPQVKAFEALGVSIAEIQNQSPEEVFEDLVERLGKIPDAATKSAIAMTLFGRSGQEMITLFNEGNPAIAQSRELLKGLGLEISRIDASKAERANDSFERLGQVVEAAKQKLGIELAPVLEGVFNQMLATGKEGGNMGEKIASGVGVAVEIFSRLNEAVFAVGNTFSAAFNLIQGIVSNTAAAVLGFASDFVTAIGTTAPNAFNSLLQAMESGLTKMKQGFADFATAAANVVVAGMNQAITAVDALVNGAAAGISKFLELANKVPGVNLGTFSYSQKSERASSFSRFPVDAVSLGRVGNFGQGAAQSLGETSGFFGRSANEQFQDAGTDVRQAFNGFGDALSAEGGDINKAFLEATDAVNKLTGSLDGDGKGRKSGGGGAGGKGGATGAMKNLADGAKTASESIKQTFKVLDEYGKAVTSALEQGIDEFVKNGKLSVSEFGASLLRDLAAITAKAAILGGILGNSQYGGNGSGLVGSFLSGIFSGGAGAGTASYAGGGFTGYGARAGGIDGKGGFPAILHPNETVVDHTTGQDAAGGVSIQQTVIVRETLPSGIAAQIVKSATAAAKSAMKDISDRGGSRRKAYRFA